MIEVPCFLKDPAIFKVHGSIYTENHHKLLMFAFEGHRIHHESHFYPYCGTHRAGYGTTYTHIGQAMVPHTHTLPRSNVFLGFFSL
jgi:hypothetical protein